MFKKLSDMYFSEEEAQEKVGRRVQNRMLLAGVPQGTCGTIKGITAGPSPVLFMVWVLWELEGGKERRDWFDKKEYKYLLREVRP